MFYIEFAGILVIVIAVMLLPMIYFDYQLSKQEAKNGRNQTGEGLSEDRPTKGRK